MNKITEKFKGHALVVDDYPLNAELVKSLLGLMEVTADIASSGEEAIKKVKETDYDIIFMDIQMAGLDGIETTKKIREIKTQKIPIIALTAHALNGDKERFLSLGLDGFLSKPLTGEALALTLRQYLN